MGRRGGIAHAHAERGGRKSVFIAGTWILLYGYGPTHGLISLLKAISRNEYLGLLTVSGNLAQVGAWWFGVDRPHDFHPVLSLLVLLAAGYGGVPVPALQLTAGAVMVITLVSGLEYVVVWSRRALAHTGGGRSGTQ